jgi:flagellin
MIADRMGADIAELSATIKASEQAEFLFGAADGGLSVVADMLADLEGLTVQAANKGALSKEEKQGLQIEAEGLVEAIEYVLANTTHNNQRVLADGFTANVVGSSYTFAGLKSGALGQEAMTDHSILDLSGPDLNLVDGDLEAAQKVVKAAQSTVTRLRGEFGRYLKFDLGPGLRAMRVQHENTLDARSKITDSDFAQEISNYFRAQVLMQASIRATQLTNQSAVQTLRLLGG